jgi:hypothetical protein
MKLAALYTVFDGLELVKDSIKQIESDVDVIIIGWQKLSNHFNESKEIESFLSTLPSHYVLVEYKPQTNMIPNDNEKLKHQLLLNKAKELNCTHFLFLATDHFYKSKEFKFAKEIALDFDVTTTKMFTYYKNPKWQLTPIEDYQMPFICRLYDNTKIDSNKYPVHTDPCVRVNTFKKFYEFEDYEIMLHHYSVIRMDVVSKFNNSAAAIRWSKNDIETFIKEYKEAKVGDSITYFKGRTLIEVDNYFNIS